jgi:Acetyltransferase (GNAT) family.
MKHRNKKRNRSMILTIKDTNEKRAIARTVLEDLTEWFEVEESREGFIRDCAEWTFLAAKENDRIMGFLCLKETGNATVELAVMGVMKEYHRNGVGRKLVEKAKEAAKADGYEFMQVKTVKMGMYEDYDRTNLFYRSCGFKELEVLPTLWDEANPCQIYVMYLK